jgi:hypothetical protein
MELINLQIEYFTAISLFFVFQCGADYVKVQQKVDWTSSVIEDSVKVIDQGSPQDDLTAISEDWGANKGKLGRFLKSFQLF